MGMNEDLEQIALQEQELVLPRLDAQTAWELGFDCSGPWLPNAASPSSLTCAASASRSSMPRWKAPRPTTSSGCAAKATSSRASIAVPTPSDSTRRSRTKPSLTAQGLPVADYATHGGSFPLSVVGAGVVGSVTVSGLPQRADHELAVEALCAMLGRDYATLKLRREIKPARWIRAHPQRMRSITAIKNPSV